MSDEERVDNLTECPTSQMLLFGYMKVTLLYRF